MDFKHEVTSAGVRRRWVDNLSYGSVFGVALGLRLLVPLTSGGLTGVYGYDASVYYSAGAALVHGRVPYRDFILLHPPGAMLATAPAAWIGRLTSDSAGFATATVLFTAIGAASAVLVVAIGRRFGFGRAASLAGGFFYAVWFVSIHAEYQSRLEPLGNLLLLCGLLGYAGVGGPHRRWSALLCGIGLGAAACVKLWYAVPLVVVLGWLAVADRRHRAAGLVALGATAAVTMICGPFLALAPSATWQKVVSQQLGRDTSNPLQQALLLRRLPAELPSWWVVYVVDAVLVVAAALLLLLALRVRAARLPVVLVFAQAALLLAAPSFYVFYLDFLTPAVALCVAAGASWRPVATGDAIGRRAARAGGMAAVAVVVVVLIVPAVGLWYGRGGNAVGRFPTSQLAPAAADVRCVMSDSPTGLIALNALSRNLANDCRNWVDVTGRTYSPDMRVRRPDGQRVPRAANRRWQRALRNYLLSGEAVIIRRAKTTGMSSSTWEEIRRGGVLASEDEHAVYRVRSAVPGRSASAPSPD
jgi:alpha-1,2-mannosyltransferase